MSKNEFVCDCTAVHEDIVAMVARKLCQNTEQSEVSALFRILGDPTRMKIIWALDVHEMCVCDIANVLSMTKSAVSHQLAVLRKADIVRFHRDNKTVYYSLADEHIQSIIETGMEHIREEKQEQK